MTVSKDFVKAENFNDVPIDHWAYNYINELKTRKITDGIGNNDFGLGKSITRAEFVKFLCNLMDWKSDNITQPSFIDNSDSSEWYFSYIETGVQKGIIDASEAFRPDDFITREEMAIMIVRTLGYNELSQKLLYLDSPFLDVKINKEYINIAKDFGIVSGIDSNNFGPNQTATREEVAVMIIKMIRILESKLKSINGFYAIRSAEQMPYINDLDMISFGWSRLEIENNNTILNTTSSNNNEYSIPTGFEKPFEMAADKQKLLMIAVMDKDSSEIINNENLRNSSINQISDAINNGIVKDNENIIFDGVVLDFETLFGETSKNNYNVFIKELKSKLNSDKKIVVALHPQRREGHTYYNGYDYKTIGNLAHDYNAKILNENEMKQGISMTPLAPIDEIYYALRAITDKNSGIEDKNKIMLQISFASAQWKLKDKEIINNKPYTPNYEDISKRIKQGVELKYDKSYESPYMKFKNEEDSTDNIAWYENNQSVDAKIKMAQMFGVENISLWRLGNIPNQGNDIGLDVMPIILSYK